MAFGAAVGTITTVACYRWKKAKTSNMQCDHLPVNKSEHCAVCLCNNPVLLKMLYERMESHNEQSETFPGHAHEDVGQIFNLNTQLNTNSIQEDGWTNFDDASNIPNLDFSISNGNTYDKEFINKCRDPAFLEVQLKKIETEYKEKMEKLESIRVSEIAKKEAQYEKINAEVLNEKIFQ